MTTTTKNEALNEDMQREAEAFKAPYPPASPQPAMRPMGTGLRLFGQNCDGSLFPVEVSISIAPSSLAKIPPAVMICVFHVIS